MMLSLLDCCGVERRGVMGMSVVLPSLLLTCKKCSLGSERATCGVSFNHKRL